MLNRVMGQTNTRWGGGRKGFSKEVTFKLSPELELAMRGSGGSDWG